jgi:hypothetical protein
LKENTGCYPNTYFPNLTGPPTPHVLVREFLKADNYGFRIDPKTNKIARGIMQVRNTTRKYLADTKVELKNYLVVLTKEQLLNSSDNICAGVRWLFIKKETATNKLKHKATWINTIEDYKGYLGMILDNQDYNHTPMEKLDKFYKILQENKNSASAVSSP